MSIGPWEKGQHDALTRNDIAAVDDGAKSHRPVMIQTGLLKMQQTCQNPSILKTCRPAAWVIGIQLRQLPQRAANPQSRNCIQSRKIGLVKAARGGTRTVGAGRRQGDAVKALSRGLEPDTQPKIPPWALIMASPAACNSGK